MEYLIVAGLALVLIGGPILFGFIEERRMNRFWDSL